MMKIPCVCCELAGTVDSVATDYFELRATSDDKVDVGRTYRWPDDFTVKTVTTVRTPEDPATVIRWRNVDSHCARHITSVLTTEDGVLRAVFVDGCAEPYVFVGSGAPAFALLDPDNGVRVYDEFKYVAIPGQRRSRRVMSKQVTAGPQGSYPWHYSRYTRDAGASYGFSLPDDQLAILRDRLHADFLSGTLDELALGPLTARGTRLCYSDTYIEFPSRELLLKTCLDAIRTSGALFRIMDRPGEDVTGGLVHIMTMPRLDEQTIVVNGVRLVIARRTSKAEAKLVYLNGHKIATEDMTTAVGAIFCHPDSQDTYDRYIRTVSKVSLKYFRHVRDGVKFVTHARTVRDLARVEAVGAGDVDVIGGDESDENDVVISCEFKKEFGKLPVVNLMGKWRRITSLDPFISAAQACSTYSFRGPNRHALDTRALRSEGSVNLAFHKMWVMSKYLHPDDSLLCPTWLVPAVRRSAWDRTQMAVPNDEKILGEIRSSLLDRYRQVAEAGKAQLLAAKERIRRSEEILKEVMERTNAKLVGDEFIVTGMSGTVYRVNRRTAAVTANEQHICIIAATDDKSGYDYIAGLLTALAKDRLTAKKIHTLKSVVEKAA